MSLCTVLSFYIKRRVQMSPCTVWSCYIVRESTDVPLAQMGFINYIGNHKDRPWYWCNKLRVYKNLPLYVSFFFNVESCSSFANKNTFYTQLQLVLKGMYAIRKMLKRYNFNRAGIIRSWDHLFFSILSVNSWFMVSIMLMIYFNKISISKSL